MRKQHNVWALGMLVLGLAVAWGQENVQQTPAGGSADNNQDQQQPAPAYGQDNPPPPITENPPLSGLDLPSLEPHAAPLSYIQPGATFSETADSNVANGVGSQSFVSVSRAIGSVTLQRLWSHYDLAMDYFGGAAYYDESGLGWKALQQMDIDQKVTWKRGELNLRDSFSYLPEGNFGGAYGSEGSQGVESLGTTAFSSFWGGAALGTFGLASRIMNVSIGDISEYLSPKSAVTVAGGYAFTHFYGNPTEGILTNAPIATNFVGSSQVSAQAGYNRVLSSHTQVGIVYGYQAFDFSVFESAFHSHVIQLMYGHRISGRMDFLIAAGPQFTHLEVPCQSTNYANYPQDCPLVSGVPVGSIPDFRIGEAGQVRLRYKFTKYSLDLSYQRFLTGGSGIFAGAQSDIGRLSVEHRLSRVWDAFADIGYSRNSRLGALLLQQVTTCGGTGQPPCPGVQADTYQYGFVGGGVHRAFGHNFHGFASYQFNELAFDQSFCAGLPACSRIGNRNVITVGLDWTPRPIRID